MTSCLSLTPIPCATLCGAASHHRPALVRCAGLQALAPGRSAGLGSRMYPEDLRIDAAMHTTVLSPTLTLALALTAEGGA